MIDFKEAKKKISIIEILVGWGYKYDKSKGAVSPNFVLRDEHGREIDRVIITHPKEPEKQGFWRRNGAKGDLIIFIKDNLSLFPVVGRNETDTINKVLVHLMGLNDNELNESNEFSLFEKNWNKLVTTPKQFNLNDYLDKEGIKEGKAFDITKYERKEGKNCIGELMPFFEERGISRDTVKVFAPFVEMVRKQTTPQPLPLDGRGAAAAWNIGFPYRAPGSDVIVGYEIRGRKGFKGKAEGTNSTSGLWLAKPSAHRGLPPRAVYFFESAFDAMAFWEVNHEKMSMESAVFASTGGAVSDQQITGTMKQYRLATAVDCFDNDLNGRIYGIRLIALLESLKKVFINIKDEVVHLEMGEKVFELAADLVDVDTFRAMTGLYGDKVRTCKAPEPYKDWNDVILKGG